MESLLNDFSPSGGWSRRWRKREGEIPHTPTYNMTKGYVVKTWKVGVSLLGSYVFAFH